MISLAVTIALGASTLRGLDLSPYRALPVYGTLEPFALRDQDGEPVTLDSLRGAVHVINFVYTSCAATCPLLTRQMASIAERARSLAPKVRFLSLSVDPRHDTPDRLKRYGEAYHADFTRWKFATGPLETVQRVVTAGFRTAMAEDAEDLLAVTHGETFVVTDRNARLRAFRHVRSEREVSDILRVAAVLSSGNL